MKKVQFYLNQAIFYISVVHLEKLGIYKTGFLVFFAEPPYLPMILFQKSFSYTISFIIFLSKLGLLLLHSLFFY